jgi:hypothetical protein
MDEPGPMLSYATPAKDRSPLHLARWAIGCACAFLPAVALGCGMSSERLIFATFLLPLAGLVLAGIARGRDDGDADARRLAKRGIWLNLGQVALIVLMSVLMMNMGKPSERVQRVKCASNLRQIGQGLLLYTNDNGPQYPPNIELLVDAADIHPEIYVCPSTGADPARGTTTREAAGKLRADPKRYCCYVYVGAHLAANSPGDCIVAYEPLENHGGEGMNVLYNDGGVDWVAKDKAAWILSELKAGRNPPSTRAAVSTHTVP